MADFWTQWCGYVKQLGINPYLTGEHFTSIVRTVTGFGGQIKRVYYGQGRQFDLVLYKISNCPI